jgi:hypothetical protein
MRWIFFNWPNPSRRTMGPGVDSASNRNEHQESSWGVKGGGSVRLTISPPSVSRLCRENVGASTSHNLMSLHGLFFCLSVTSHGRFPISLLTPYNIKFVQRGFAELTAIEESNLRVWRGFIPLCDYFVETCNRSLFTIIYLRNSTLADRVCGVVSATNSHGR